MMKRYQFRASADSCGPKRQLSLGIVIKNLPKNNLVCKKVACSGSWAPACPTFTYLFACLPPKALTENASALAVTINTP